MALMPKREKHRKVQRGSRKGIAQSGSNLAFGEYGLRCMGRTIGPPPATLISPITSNPCGS